jgi:hypothetical protein
MYQRLSLNAAPIRYCYRFVARVLERTGSITKIHFLIACVLPDREGGNLRGCRPAWHDCSLGVIMKGAGGPP